MLKDCLEIFDEEMKRVEKRTGDRDRIILDRYILDNGIYILVRKSGETEICTIKMDKKTRRLEQIPANYEELCFFDYHSKLVSMQKPQDTEKAIHSNNHLSFWVKQKSFEDGKLNEEAIDRYFDILANPRKKYKDSSDRKMYEQIEQQIGEVDREKLEKNREWIKANIFNLEKIGVQWTNPNEYLKIFFEADRALYIQEEKRYVRTKIFNKNSYNIEIKNQMLGLPDNNLGFNDKKPYLQNRTRKVTQPYLIPIEEAEKQRKFFEYLMNQANVGKTNLFFDTEEKKIVAKKNGEMIEKEFSGYFLKIQKGRTEIEIHHQDTIVSYQYRMKKPFLYGNVLGLKEKEEQTYKEYRNKKEMQALINEILFSKYLVQNYFVAVKEIRAEGEIKRNIISSRDAIFAWLYKGRKENISQILHKTCMNLIKNSIKNGFTNKMGLQFNLMCSLDEYFGGKDMADKYQKIRENLREKINQTKQGVIESDEEYFYAVGQLVYYFISLSKTGDKNHSLANPFLNTASNEFLQRKLRQYFLKYNYQISFYKGRFERLYGMVMGYILEGKISQEDILAGYISDNLIYEVKKQEENEQEENREEA